MKKILYLYISKDDISACCNLTYQLINQNNPINNLLNVIIETEPQHISLISNYFNQSNTEFIIESSNKILYDIVNVKNFSHIVVINEEFLYNKNFNQDIINICQDKKLTISCSKKTKTITVFPIVEIKEKSIKQLMFSNDPFSGDTIILSSIHHIGHSFKSINYDDQNCVFCDIDHGFSELKYLDSYIYINKNNNKVFNISNNIFGYLIAYDKNFCEIDWVVDMPTGKRKLVKYKKLYNSNKFVAY